jgi:hypothetical protein
VFDGVIVTCAGKIFYAEDKDGNGVPEKREDWFTGFVEDNQQLRVNSLRWGLDDWIYCASGGHHAGFGVNTVITCAKNGKKIKLGARDFRPATGSNDPSGRNRKSRAPSLIFLPFLAQVMTVFTPNPA